MIFDIHFIDHQYVTFDHVVSKVSDGILYVYHIQPDDNGIIWTDAYPLATIDWFRLGVKDETKTDTTGQPVQ